MTSKLRSELSCLLFSSSCFLIMHARRVCVSSAKVEQMQTLSERSSRCCSEVSNYSNYLSRAQGWSLAPSNQQLSDMCFVHKLTRQLKIMRAFKMTAVFAAAHNNNKTSPAPRQIELISLDLITLRDAACNANEKGEQHDQRILPLADITVL